MSSKMKRRLGKLWREWLRSLLVMVILVTSFRSAVADWNDVPTGSMKPTILEGDRIVVNKLAYDLKLPFTTVRVATWSHPERGDIVVLFSPVDGKRLVKRVVGLPGDVISMRHNHLLVNGEAVEYEPVDPKVIEAIGYQLTNQELAEEDLGEVKHPIMLTPTAFSLHSFAPITIPAGKYFVMGDNRDQSFDSRHFGFIPRKLIVGRATAVAASVNPEKRYAPRWERFFQALR